MANSLYDKGREKFLNGEINWTSDTIKISLVSDNYTPDVSTHEFADEITSSVLSTVTLSGKTSTNGVADCSDLLFTGLGIGDNANYLVVFKDTGVDSTSPLIALIDTATNLPIVTNGGDIAVTIDSGANKLFKL